MLVNIQWSQRSTKSAEEGRQPQEFARQFLDLGDGAGARVHKQVQEGTQTGQLIGVKGRGHKIKVKSPANPHHGRAEGSLMPAHRHAQDEQEHDNEASHELGGGPLQQCEDVIHIHEGGM